MRVRSERGAAMAEMVLLAPIMILMWMGIDYFRAGYARRLDALAQSHAQAWKLAYSNDGSCFQGNEPWSGFSGENNAFDPNNTGDEGSGAASAFKSGTSSSLFSYSHAFVDAQEALRAAHLADGSLGGGNVKGGTYITCNEVVPATNAESGVGSSGYSQFADQNVLTPLVDWVKSLF